MTAGTVRRECTQFQGFWYFYTLKQLSLEPIDYNDRQLQIIQAAITLMGEGGIQQLTTKNLAHAVGVTEPALYRHFEDKIDILRNVLEYLKSRILGRLERIVHMELTPPLKLRELVNRQYTAFEKRPEVVVVLLSEGLYQHNRGLSEMIHSIMKESARYYTLVIEEGQQMDYFRRDVSAERIAFMLMGTMRFCVIQWHLAGYAYPLLPKGEELYHDFMRMLAPGNA